MLKDLLVSVLLIVIILMLSFMLACGIIYQIRRERHYRRYDPWRRHRHGKDD